MLSVVDWVTRAGGEEFQEIGTFVEVQYNSIIDIITDAEHIEDGFRIPIFGDAELENHEESDEEVVV